MRDRIYPWDVMDRIRDAIRPLGIILSYSTPSLSKEEFDRRVKGPEEGISEALEVEVQEQSGA
jgi:hypothetical protein